jgi:hypothetical protein
MFIPDVQYCLSSPEIMQAYRYKKGERWFRLAERYIKG